MLVVAILIAVRIYRKKRLERLRQQNMFVNQIQPYPPLQQQINTVVYGQNLPTYGYAQNPAHSTIFGIQQPNQMQQQTY